MPPGPLSKAPATQVPLSSAGADEPKERQTTNAWAGHLALLRLTDALGPLYGTEDFSLFLHAIIRMERPQTIVELGTGFGVSGLWMALAARLNGTGHVYSVDDCTTFADDPDSWREVVEECKRFGIEVDASDPLSYFADITRQVGVVDEITFIRQHVDFQEPGHFDRYPFADHKLDLVFSDYNHGPSVIFGLLDQILPRMAPTGSIFIHSVPKVGACSAYLHQLVEEINRRAEPGRLTGPERTTIQVVDLFESKSGEQSSASWLRLLPDTAR